ncbi:Cell division topological specificity factor MinE [Klebsiella pneumoniae IS43]|uniref:Cell division topological specificity factor n=2 Tax=Klebsiella pneumoniae TaxID=573 RepID=W1DQI3_KLEPN|nr:Cell division topological specificity factor MinE [Klebsiella pneumoniae IS43]
MKKRRKDSSNACSEDKLWLYSTFFLSRKKNTANIAKERLQIIVAERRRGDAEPHYLPQLRKDILEVICKYVQIDPEMVSVQLEQRDGDISILELNVTLPETEESKS